MRKNNIRPVYLAIIRFIVYYFGFFLLIRTLFAPWKRQYWRKKSRGLAIGEMLFVAVSNILSRCIGCIIRMATLLFGLCILATAIVTGPLFAAILLTFFRNSFICRDGPYPLRSAVWNWHYGYTPIADRFSVELYDKPFVKGSLVGMEEEYKTATRIFQQNSGHNIMLVSEPGSGRRSLMNMLAHAHINLRFLQFDHVRFFKGIVTKSEQAAALTSVLREAERAGNVVLIIPHFETLTVHFSVMEPYLASPSVHIAGVVATGDYHQLILPDKSIMQYFTTLEIRPLTEDQLRDVAEKKTEQSPWGTFPKTAIDEFLAGSYTLMSLEQKGQPEALISLIDEFFSWAQAEKKYASKHDMTTLTAAFFQERFDVPSTAPLSDAEREKLRDLERVLSQRVISQQTAISQISRALRRRRLQLSGTTKPIGSFLFLGPTGVGKTETAKALASIFFEREDLLLRFDMSRFQQKTQINELVDELAQKIREEPYGVLLLDEIEKANKDLLHIFLTIFDEGYFLDSHRAKILCNNVIIICTSNAASAFIRELGSDNTHALAEAFGQPSQESQPGQVDTMVNQRKVVDFLLRNNVFSPEFINRLDDVVIFGYLSSESLKKIAAMKLKLVQSRLQQTHKKTFNITPQLIDTVVASCVQQEFGARELDRVIKRIVEDTIAEELLKT